MRVLYLDCFSGISGDMTVGALCDLGVKPSALEWELSKLELGDFHMHFERAKRREIEGVKFSIHEGATHTHATEPAHEHGHSHAHDEPHQHAAAEGAHDHCHGHEHEPARAHHEAHEHGHADGHSHSDEEAHSHDAGHSHGHEHHGHEHSHEHEHHDHGRSHREIAALIEASGLSDFVKQHALSIFQRIAEAEGKIHGMPVADVHFHEVGALDSIADIICTCAGIEVLGVEKVLISPLHDGRGWIDCAHGRFPVPAPATLEILKGIPVAQIDEPHELITPTGAAIVAEFGVSFGPMPRLRIERIGYGLGTRDLASRPNVLRAVLGELEPE